MNIILQVLENIILLTFLGFGFYTIETARQRLAPTTIVALHGLSFGLIAFLVTSTPVQLTDGATLDARAGPVIAAGLVGGPIAAGIAAVLGGLARGFIGGSFAFAGMFAYVLYAALGSAAWAMSRHEERDFLKVRMVAMLALSSCVAASLMFFLIQPKARALTWVREDLPYIWCANILSLVVTMLVLGAAFGVLAKAQQIEEANERLRLAKRASGFGVWDFNIKTGKLTWDARSRELHGIDANDFHGTFEDWAGNVHPDDLGRTQDAFANAIENTKSFDAEYRVVHPDGGVTIIKGDAVLLRDGAGQAVRVVGTNLDITPIRTAEAKLREAQLVAVQAQKFDTIGQLTGGVAHDFNNLLAVIMGNLELVMAQLGSRQMDIEEVRSLLDASIDASRRGADLTQNMLAYARKARLMPVELDLNDVVRETEKWMRRTIPSRIEIETSLQAGLWLTRADQSSLQSAVVNLLVNARDAFDGSGQVTIETSNLRVDQDYIDDRQEDIAPGRYVMLAISDNGRGIEPEVLDSIFDPFFTTKEIGEGSGLGLSMVQGFVKQSGGAIRVYSEPGVGTSFKMYFPAVSAAASTAASNGRENRGKSAEAAQRHRILLVEDRTEVLLVLRKTLESAGYDVDTAASGDEGFARFKRSGPYDLVVTDIVMPGELQGPSMAREIRLVAPGAKFIFLSGYATESTVHGNGLRPEDIRLMKPVSRVVLLAAVEGCLQADAPPDTRRT